MNIGSLIGILGLATFLCDIVALYVHRQSDVYRQQKFQDVDLNLLRLETLNSIAENVMDKVAKRKQQAHVEEDLLNDNVFENSDATGTFKTPTKEKFRRNKENHYYNLCDNALSLPTVHPNQTIPPILPLNDNSRKQISMTKNSQIENSLSSIKQRCSITTRSSQLKSLSGDADEVVEIHNRLNSDFVDEGSPQANEIDPSNDELNSYAKSSTSIINKNARTKRPPVKLETFL